MISSAIEALYICNNHNEPIFEHVYRSRPASATALLPLYLAQAVPRSPILYIADINPPTTLFSITYSNILILSPVSVETEALFVFEFLHRLVDVLEEFLGAPLLSSKIEGAYDVVAQLVGEMCDAGNVSNTEPNSLRDDVVVPGLVGKLLGGVGLSSATPSLNPNGSFKPQLSLNPATSGPAIPWRRANVRHTSNELYVDIVETLSVTLAPSGRPLAAFANGSILFNSKISGIPDLILNLTSSGGRIGMEKAIELPVFHPCVRLTRWKEKPGELSFVPPDGKFLLASYEVNLMPTDLDLESWFNVNLGLPVSIEVSKSLGPIGADFEVRILLNSLPGGTPAPASRSSGTPRGSGRSTPNPFATGTSSNAPALQNVIATVPLPSLVRNVKDLRSSRGEAYFSPSNSAVEWRISARDAAAPGVATLRCTVVGAVDDEIAVDAGSGMPFAASGDYDENEDAYQSASSQLSEASKTKEVVDDRDPKKIQQRVNLMPSSACVSFSIKGWLASGIKVSSLNVDTRKSRGLGDGVKPYKGVKYMTVSKQGVETRC